MNRSTSSRSRGKLHAASGRMNTFSFEDAAEILEKAASLGKMLPIVGDALEGVLQLASTICKDVETVKSNREELRALAQDAALCTWAITSELKKMAEERLLTYFPYIEELRNVCAEIDDAFERLGQDSRMKRFMKKGAHGAQISELRSKLSAASTRFGISIQLASKITLDQLQESVDSMRSDLYTVRSDVKTIIQNQTDSDLRALLEKLEPVAGAYNSDAVDRSIQYCTPGTRTELLAQIVGWAGDEETMLPVYWLSGLAGTGKSTVARTVCNQLAQQGVPVVSLFISRESAERNDPSRIPGTLAYQMGMSDPGLSVHIADAIQATPGITTRSISDQVDILIAKPLRKASPLPGQLVLVIDALDECEKRDGREGGMLLATLASALAHPDLQHRVKLFVTSREEASIHSIFSEIRAVHGPHTVLQLHMLDAAMVRTDIRLYLELNLRRIASRFPSLSNAGWPSDDDVATLVEFSGVLFTVASTLVRFLDSDRHNPARLLGSLLLDETKVYGSPYQAVDKLYAFVLDAAINSAQDPDDILCKRLRSLLGSILILREPVPVNVLAGLTAEDEVDTMLMLQHLGSILLIAPNNPVRVFHTSLGDYALNSSRCLDKRLLIDVDYTHDQLATGCFKALRCSEPHTCTIIDAWYNDIKSLHPSELRPILGRLPQDFVYALRWWSHHLLNLSGPIPVDLCKELSLLFSRDLEPQYWIKASLVLRISPQWPAIILKIKALSTPQHIMQGFLMASMKSFLHRPVIYRVPPPFLEASEALNMLASHFSKDHSPLYDVLGHLLETCANLCKMCQHRTRRVWRGPVMEATFYTLAIVHKVQEMSPDQRSVYRSKLQEMKGPLAELGNNRECYADIRGSPNIVISSIAQQFDVTAPNIVMARAWARALLEMFLQHISLTQIGGCSCN